MRSIFALIRSTFLSASSYRIGITLSIVGLLAAFLPIFFLARAVQPVMAASIQDQGGDAFGFIIFGIAATMLITAAIGSIPGAVQGSIANGTLEALLVTRTPLYQTLIGIISYGLIWAALRATIMVTGATVLGMRLDLSAAPVAVLIAVLLVIAYLALGGIAASLVLVFRTAGPFTAAVVAGSGLLGGVYYPTSVIPSWLQDVAALFPLTHALPAVRQLMLDGAPVSAVVDDVMLLAIFAAGLTVVSVITFMAAIRYARKAGTLAQY